MAGHIHPVKIPPRYYRPIGQILAGWNLTEALLSSIVWKIHGITNPKRGRLFTYRPSAREKLNIVNVTLKHFADAAMYHELKGLLDRASSLNTQRNKIAHGLWGRVPGDYKNWKIFYHRSTDDMVLLKREVMSVSDVANIALAVERLNRDLKKWMAKRAIPPP